MPEPGSVEWYERVAGLLLEESLAPLRWWWLSFADDAGFRGVVIIQAHGNTDAVMRTHRAGINPGGQVLGIEILAEKEHLVPESMRNRVLSRAEAESL